MVLETLKVVKHHKHNIINFKIQNEENGVDGCNVSCLIETAKIMLRIYGESFSSM